MRPRSQTEQSSQTSAVCSSPLLQATGSRTQLLLAGVRDLSHIMTHLNSDLRTRHLTTTDKRLDLIWIIVLLISGQKDETFVFLWICYISYILHLITECPQISYCNSGKANSPKLLILELQRNRDCSIMQVPLRDV